MEKHPSFYSRSERGWRGFAKRLYHLWLTAAGGGKGVPRRLPDGGTAYLLPSCRHVDWSLPEYTIFTEHIKPGDVVLDVGANVGFNSILFGRLVGPSGKVVAFEPAPMTYEALRHHLTVNGLDATVKAVNAALGDQAGELQFFADGLHGTNHVASEAERGGANTVRVPCLPLDDYCAANSIRPTAIKIDTEGFELPVLRGARETIRAAGPKLVIFLELHPQMWPKLGFSRAELERELDSLGLVARTSPPGIDPWVEASPWSLVYTPR